MAEIKKINKGKQKITMEPILNKPKKQVTFSKRRQGLFKKATELCILCGAQLAVVTFSSAGKLFSFGHPDSDAVIRRFMNDHNLGDANDGGIITRSFFDADNRRDSAYKYNEVVKQIDAEKKQFTSPRENQNSGFWWEKPIDDLELVELERFKVALEGLRNQVASKLDHQMINHNNHNNPMVSGFVDGNNCVAQTAFANGRRDDYGLSGDSLLDMLLN
ncbi:Agamous-like MADS-box protein AGL62 [Bienertia sinuspersici]